MAEKDRDWLDLIRKLLGWLRGFIAFVADLGGFVSVVVGVVRYWQGETDRITVALIAVGVVIAGIGWLGCLYTLLQGYRDWKARCQAIVKPRRIRSQPWLRRVRPWLRWVWSDKVQRLGLFGLVVIPLLALAGLGVAWYVQGLPPDKIIVLVADFDGLEPQKYRVTETVLACLRQALEPYQDVEVEALGRTITEAKGSIAARTEGEKRKAAIVIWGWYGVTVEAVPLSVHFEVLRPPKYMPELGPEAKGQVQTMPVAELQSFTLQIRLSSKMAYLSLFTVGMARYAAEDWDGAIASFSDALNQTAERVPALDQSTIYFYKGKTYPAKGDYDQAIADFNKAIELRPGFVEAYYNRGVVYAFKRDYDQAIADFTKAIELRPDFVNAYNNRGTAYANIFDHDQAIADFTEAIKLKPDLAEAYYNRGNAYVHINIFDYDLPIADYDKAIELRPDFADAYCNRGLVYAIKGDYDQAIADFTKAIELRPDDADAYISRGHAYYHKGDYDQAIVDYTKAIELKPDDALAYINRGDACVLMGEKEKAIADFKKVLELSNDPYVRQQAEEQLKALGAK